MARSVDVLADVLDDQGTWQRVVLRVSPYDGYFQSLRDLDYIGTFEFVSGGLVGTGARACSCHCEDAPVPQQWIARLIARVKENK